MCNLVIKPLSFRDTKSYYVFYVLWDDREFMVISSDFLVLICEVFVFYF